MHLAEIHANHALMSDGHQLLHFIVCLKNVPYRIILSKLAYLKALASRKCNEEKKRKKTKLLRRFTVLIWSYFSHTQTNCFCNIIN